MSGPGAQRRTERVDGRAPSAPRWHLYLVRTPGGALYTGIATDVVRRLAEHRGGGRRGAKRLRSRAPLALVYQVALGDRALAAAAEHRVKRLDKARKERLVAEAPDRGALLARLAIDPAPP